MSNQLPSKPPRVRFQFTITALLALTVAVSSAVVLVMDMPGLLFIVVVFAYWAVWRLTVRVSRSLAGCFCLFVIPAVAMTGALLLPAVSSARNKARTEQCARNMAVLARALRAYHAEFGQFPPACVRDTNGRPLCSWRILILPYLGHEDLYKRYRFDEPWDSPHNQTLLQEIPDEYECPSLCFGDKGMTNYAAVVGPDTMWPEDGVMRLDDLPVDAADAVLLVDISADDDIAWTEPRDFPVEEVASGFHDYRPVAVPPSAPRQLPAMHSGLSAHFAMADGSVRSVPGSTAPDAILDLILISRRHGKDLGGVIHGPLGASRPPLSPAGRWVAAVAFLLSVGTIVVSVRRRRRVQLAAPTELPAEASQTGSNQSDSTRTVPPADT